MGLDISAASHLRFLDPQPDSDEEEERLLEGGCFLVQDYGEQWPGHATDREPGIYELTAESEQHGFRAGSYSGYNFWRATLCKFALGVEPDAVWQNPDDYVGKPFAELVNFSDAEGCIGPAVSAKLAQDFDDHADAALEFAPSLTDDESKFFLQNYGDFATAFAIAAVGGAVVFG